MLGVELHGYCEHVAMWLVSSLLDIVSMLSCCSCPMHWNCEHAIMSPISQVLDTMKALDVGFYSACYEYALLPMDNK